MNESFGQKGPVDEERVKKLANETEAFEQAGIPPQQAVEMAEQKVKEEEEKLNDPDRYNLGDIKDNLAA